MSNYKLTIIVPVYQVENYIRACVESIFMQGLNDDDFEVILVDDGTRDGSFDRISDIIKQHTNIIIVRQENQGLSAARNTGLTKATGEYILFLDSDDLLVANSLEPLLQDASQNHSDLIVADFIKLDDKGISDGLRIPASHYRSNTVVGTDLFVNHLNPRECYVWRTLYKKSFLDEHNLRFIPGIYFEDVPFTTECYLKANKCVKTNHLFYVYRQRPGSICSAISKEKVMGFHEGMAQLWELKDTLSLSEEQNRKLMGIIFATFSVEVWYITHNPALMAERKAIINDLKQKIPDLCFTNSIKQRLVSLMFRLMPSAYLEIRSL